jgi:A/G-specific adenine glycosylase
VQHFGGRLPETAEALTELPGIGPSTANAIVSLAFGQPAAILDGNVKRLLARQAGIEGWPGNSKVQRLLWREAESRLPTERAADYSQAIMDLGAMVCVRGKPDCEKCPVRSDCRALELGVVARLPTARPGKAVPEKTIHMLVIHDELGRVLLQRRPPTGIWGGLWSFPEGDTRQEAAAQLGLNGAIAHSAEPGLPALEHRLTHLHLHIEPTLMTLPQPGGLECTQLRENSELAWFDKQAWEKLGLPKPVNDLLRELDP